MPVLWTLAILLAEPPDALAADQASQPERWGEYVQFPATGLDDAVGYVTPLDLSVAPDGRVTGCEAGNNARRGSASQSFQHLVCDALVAHARFLPARDGLGTPIAGRVAIYVLLGKGPAQGEVKAPEIRPQPERPKLRPVPPIVQSATRPEPTPSLARGVRPVGPVDEWVSNNDVPPDYVSATPPGSGATTRFRLEIDRTGNVSDCLIVQSSGFESLDAVTCRLLIERARFEPALDNSGNPTAGAWSSSIRWIHPSK